MMGAKALCRDGESLGWKRLGQVLAIGLVPFLFIAKQPDLGSGLTVLVLLGGMVLFHGVKWKVLRVCLVVIPLLMPLGWFVLHDYQQERILTFLDPTRDPRGAGYHIIQSQIAIGSGEMFGKGFLAGTQSQLRFLPEKHTDFAIAVLGEEWGFAGCMTLVTLFCLFLMAMYSTVRDAKDRFGCNARRRHILLFFLADHREHRHGCGTHARGGHAASLHQLRRHGPRGELCPRGHSAQHFHAPFRFQKLTDGSFRNGESSFSSVASKSPCNMAGAILSSERRGGEQRRAFLSVTVPRLCTVFFACPLHL